MGNLKEKIEEIVTYHSDEGTSGYLLSNEQIEAILSLIKEHEEGVIGEDENEIQDMDRKLYFVGRNDLRAEQRKRI